VFDDTEDEWRRVDFTLKDCSGDAEWVAQTRKQRENKSSGDIASLAGKVGAKNPAHITPSMLQDSAPKGETADYKWRQTEDEVEITLKREGIVKADLKLTKVIFARQRLRVEIKGDVLIDSVLGGMTTPDECTWTLSDGEMQINLSKANAESWPGLVKG